MQQLNKITILYSVFIAAFALYCYNPFVLYFQNDDFIHIPLSAAGFILQHNTFRPFCDLSIMLDYRLYGTNASGYHATNLLLHITACIILFFLSKLALKKYFITINHADSYSLLTVLLFFIYSSHSEAVFWILGRSAILGAIFSMLFLYGYLLKNISKKYVVLYITSLLLGLLSYESCWVLPVFSLLLYFKDYEKGEWKHPFTVCCIFTLYLLVRWSFIYEIAGDYEAAAFINGNITALLKNYLLLASRSFLPAFNSNIILLFFFIALLFTLLLFFFKCRKLIRKKIIFVLIFFFTSLIIYASIGVDTNGTEGERFLYFPCAILSFAVVTVICSANIKAICRHVFICTFFIAHLVVLYASAGNYLFAGETTRLIITEIQNLKNTSTVGVSGLPQSQNGATVFRMGLPEAVQWLSKSSGIDNVIICSKRSELNPLRNPYKVKYTNDSGLNCNGSLLKYAATFNFTDSVLYISR